MDVSNNSGPRNLGNVDVSWDVLVITETWREHGEEMWQTSRGHTYCGGGGTKGSRGTGFLVHRRWKIASFRAMGERVSFIDVRIKNKTARIVGVYMPHGGYPEQQVDAIYDVLDSILDGGRKNKYYTAAAGDFNAEVGIWDEHYDSNVLGCHGLPRRNSRGDLLIQWCTKHSLAITSTHFHADETQCWTYSNGGVVKRLDYILLDRWLFKQVSNSGAEDKLDVGSDHRATTVTINLDMSTSKRQQRKTTRAQSWTVDVATYQGCLSKGLQQIGGKKVDIDERCSSLEEVMVEAAAAATKDPAVELTLSSHDAHIKELIGERRRLQKIRVLQTLKNARGGRYFGSRFKKRRVPISGRGRRAIFNAS